MEEKTMISKRYNVLDVREIFENNHRTIIMVCKEYDKDFFNTKRRRIEISQTYSKTTLYEDARLIVPGDIILVHESVVNSVHTIDEIEY